MGFDTRLVYHETRLYRLALAALGYTEPRFARWRGRYLAGVF